MNEIWLARADDDTCEDCINRHAEVKTHEEWRQLGLPGKASCSSRRGCRCELLPYRGDPNAGDPDVSIKGL